MKLFLSLLSGGLLLASMSSCTNTYVEERHHAGLGGYRSASSGYHTGDHNYRSTSHNYRPATHDTHVRVSSHSSSSSHHSSPHRGDTRVKAKVHGPLGISTGAAVEVR